jgi:A/G-specific adenine glycosylase
VGLGAKRTLTMRRAYRRRVAVYARAVDGLLRAWFEQHARDLPWRHTRDPYAILVSEVMLQQTQVERVVPRWRAWLERWPTVEALAATPTADVIREWQGLGYNRRAVNLQRASRIVADSGWPERLEALPGVGPYTAAAVRNFAWGDPVLPVDTNVGRILERTGHAFPADLAQALFDLGSTVCLGRVPRCDSCPLAAECPSRGRRYEPARRQSPFAGSFRERRARLLRSVAEEPVEVAAADREAAESLARDGLVVIGDGAASLPA